MDSKLHILECDKQFARQRIAELEAEILSLGPEFYEVFNQSSETWHDNAPFEALRDRQSLLDAELQHLKRVLKNSLTSLPKQKPGKVGIGSKITVKNTKSNKKVNYEIAGDWSPRAGQNIGEHLIVSSQAPIAKALIGKKPNDQVEFNGQKVVIESLK